MGLSDIASFSRSARLMAHAKPTPAPQGATGVLVLADGTTIWGRGFGAEGEAVGEVCFNTAMTGYQEVMTDPSYARQIIAFTFPHIGNVGAITRIWRRTIRGRWAAWSAGRDRAVQLPQRAGLRRLDEGERPDRALGRGHTGADPPDPRAGAPNGVIAHNAAGAFDVEALPKARNWPGLEGWISPRSLLLQMYRWQAAFGVWAVGDPLSARERAWEGADGF
jgi:carbamoyl-phosphate synthase small subunit